MYNFGASAAKAAGSGSVTDSGDPYGHMTANAVRPPAPVAYPGPMYGSGSYGNLIQSPGRVVRQASFAAPGVGPIPAPIAVMGPGSQSAVLKKSSSTLASNNSGNLPQQHTTFSPCVAYAPVPANHEQSSPRTSSPKSHSRSRSSDAKDKDSQLARLRDRSSTDQADAASVVSSSSSSSSTSKKSKEGKRSFFGKKKHLKENKDSSSRDDLHSSSELEDSGLMLGSGGLPLPVRGPSPVSANPRTLRDTPPAFIAALDSSFMRRSSYIQLVDKGIMREWNDSPHASPLSGSQLATVSPASARQAAETTVKAVTMHTQPVQSGAPLVVPSTNDGGWHVERGSSQDFVEGAYNALEDDQSCSPYFKLYFYGKEHTNYWGVDSRVGPILVSVALTQPRSGTSRPTIESVATFRASAQRLLPGNTGQRRMFGFTANDARQVVVHRCLVQSKFGSKQIFVRSAPDKNTLFKGLALACAPMGFLPEIQDIRFKKVEVDVTDDLMKMERSYFYSDYKFGLLYYKSGQTENEMFSNETSPELERFLDFLGDRITLKGWSGFSGGLDTKKDTTGTQSVFTNFRELNIMFHVCTLLPFFPKDPQQLERKRHVGNDIVVVVYLEPGAVFDPCMMKTQFNHIYAIVSVDPIDQSVRLELAVKQGVRPFGPQLPPSQRFFLDSSFREFLFTKLVNSERAALKAAVFAHKLEHTRKKMLEAMIDRIQKSK